MQDHEPQAPGSGGCPLVFWDHAQGFGAIKQIYQDFYASSLKEFFYQKLKNWLLCKTLRKLTLGMEHV